MLRHAGCTAGLIEAAFSADTLIMTYDELGRRRTLSYPNGITTAYEYDAASRLKKIDYRKGGGSLDTLEYDYDLNGNRTSLGFGNTLQAVPEVFEDPSYDDANELLAFGGNKTMEYDENGNMRLYVVHGYGFLSYTFNARNQLEEVNGTWGYTVHAKFRYDALGRRIEKTVDGVTTKYIYDGLDVVAEVTGSGAVKYVRTLNVDEPLARIQPGGVVRYYHADALGSVIALTDTSGNVKTAYRYSPFGQTEAYGEASTNPYQYTGRENDGPTLLYHYRARYYSPLLRRFISQDPIGFAGGDVNWYAYVWNDPLNWIDPLGLWAFGVNISATGGAGGMVDASGGIFFDRDEVALLGSFSGNFGPQLGVAAGLSISFSGADDIRELCGDSKDINIRLGPLGGLTFSMPQDASWYSLTDWLDKALFTWDTPLGFNWAAGIGYGGSKSGMKSIYRWQ